MRLELLTTWILSSLALGAPRATNKISSDLVGSIVKLDCRLSINSDQRTCSHVVNADGTFHGLEDESTGIIYFRGVRFADPPVNNLRWRAPVSPPSVHLGDVNATQVLVIGPSPFSH